MASFIQDYYLIFMVLLLSLSVLIILRTITGFLLQSAFFALIVLVNQTDLTWFINILFFIQIAFTLVVIYQLIVFINRNHQIVLEKTHAKERKITQHNYTGISNKSEVK